MRTHPPMPSALHITIGGTHNNTTELSSPYAPLLLDSFQASRPWVEGARARAANGGALARGSGCGPRDARMRARMRAAPHATPRGRWGGAWRARPGAGGRRCLGGRRRGRDKGRRQRRGARAHAPGWGGVGSLGLSCHRVPWGRGGPPGGRAADWSVTSWRAGGGGARRRALPGSDLGAHSSTAVRAALAMRAAVEPPRPRPPNHVPRSPQCVHAPRRRRARGGWRARIEQAAVCKGVK